MSEQNKLILALVAENYVLKGQLEILQQIKTVRNRAASAEYKAKFPNEQMRYAALDGLSKDIIEAKRGIGDTLAAIYELALESRRIEAEQQAADNDSDA